jgi:hypothetical protein
MRTPGELLQERFKEQLLRADLSKFPVPPVNTEEKLGTTIKEMFDNKLLTKMWIDGDTHEVHVQ